MRSLFLFCIVGILTVGSSLFFTKQYVADVRSALVAARSETKMLAEATHMLKVEWAYLTRPDRLQTLMLAHKPNTQMRLADAQKLKGAKVTRLAARTSPQRMITLAELPLRGDAPGATRLAALP